MSQVDARPTRLRIYGVALPSVRWIRLLWHYRGWAGGIALCIGVLAFRYLWLVARGGPSGPDPGDWLAFGHDLFGERVRAARSVFPPVVPTLAEVFSLLLSPLPGLALLGAIASVATGPAVFGMAYQFGGAFWATVVTVGILFLPYSVGEALGWGGYPQMLGQGLVLASLALLGLGIVGGAKRAYLVLSAVAGLLAMATSVWATAFLALTVPLLLATALLQGLVRLTALKQVGVWWLPLILIGGALLAPVYWAYFANFASVPLNPGQMSPQDAFAYVFREWPGRLGSIFFVVPLAAALASYCLWPRGVSPLGLVAPPLIVASLALYFPTQETRFLSLLEIGIWIGAYAVLADLWTWGGTGGLPSRFGAALRLGVLGLALALTVFVAVQGQKRTVAAYEWYQVVTADAHQALEWLRVHGKPGSVVVASGNPRDFPYYWWIEGYARLPSYSATDPRWMALKDEVVQNAVARQLLTSTSPTEIVSLAQEHRIRYLFLDKRVVKDAAPFVEAGFLPAFENVTILVLERQ